MTNYFRFSKNGAGIKTHDTFEAAHAQALLWATIAVMRGEAGSSNSDHKDCGPIKFVVETMTYDREKGYTTIARTPVTFEGTVEQARAAYLQAVIS